MSLERRDSPWLIYIKKNSIELKNIQFNRVEGNVLSDNPFSLDTSILEAPATVCLPECQQVSTIHWHTLWFSHWRIALALSVGLGAPTCKHPHQDVLSRWMCVKRGLGTCVHAIPTPYKPGLSEVSNKKSSGTPRKGQGQATLAQPWWETWASPTGPRLPPPTPTLAF